MVLCLVAQSCPTLWDPVDCSPPGSSVYGDSPGKTTGVGCHALLKGIFPIQGSNSGLPHCRWILYRLSHQGSPRVLELFAVPSSRESFRHRDWTHISCFLRWQVGFWFFFFFFTTSATWEAQFLFWALYKSKLWASLFKSEMNKFAFMVYNNYWFIVSIVRQILFLNSCWLCHLLSM